MGRSYHDKDAEYRRRLRIIAPLAAVMHVALFFSTANVPYTELQHHLGWKGPPHDLSEITLIPDNDPFEDTREESRTRAMRVLEVEELVETGPAEGPAQPIVKEEEEPEQEVGPALDELTVRHYPAHTEIPYSEDYIILHMIKPEYPRNELKNGIEGDVTLELLIDDAGFVENVWVLLASGPRSFEQASLDAARQFRFKPPIVDGKPTQMWIRFQIRFRIAG
jgi:TonB family protein